MRKSNLFYNVEGVEKNYSEALGWYMSSANQGNADAQYNVGLCYYYGNGVKQDYKETKVSTFYETETWEDPLRYYVPPQQDTSGDLTDDEAWWAIASGMMSVDSAGM